MKNLNMDGEAAVKPVRIDNGRAPDKPEVVDINADAAT
jgi:hypothetical protein